MEERATKSEEPKTAPEAKEEIKSRLGTIAPIFKQTEPPSHDWDEKAIIDWGANRLKERLLQVTFGLGKSRGRVCEIQKIVDKVQS